jgi:hypothetical protein
LLKVDRNARRPFLMSYGRGRPLLSAADNRGHAVTFKIGTKLAQRRLGELVSRASRAPLGIARLPRLEVAVFSHFDLLLGQLLSSEMIPMALIKLLVAPIRRVVNFPLFQLTVAIAVIVLLQAADSRSVFR